MSFKSHYRAYQEFLTLLTKFANNCESLSKNSKAIARSEVVEPIAIKQEFEVLQQWFQEHIISLSAEELEPAIALRWQSIQTEIKREFRLLTTDVIFLASSRQSATQTKRLQQQRDRLQRLIDYCQGILTIIS